jgi:hypothetical protein
MDDRRFNKFTKTGSVFNGFLAIASLDDAVAVVAREGMVTGML